MLDQIIGENNMVRLDPLQAPTEQQCEHKVQAAAQSALGRSVVYEGPAQGPGLSRSGYRKGAYNFNFFVPGYTPGSSLCGRYLPAGVFGALTGIGPSLHIVSRPGFCNPTGDPTAYMVGQTPYGYGFPFTAHIDSAFAFNPVGFFWHLINDVLDKSNHGC